MGKLFYIMGKSATGKDTLYKRLIRDRELPLKGIVSYTTRPIREGEKNGVEYYFVNEELLKQMEIDGQVIEKRVYQTVFGPWVYFTANDGQLDFSKNHHYIAIGTLQSYKKLCSFFGRDSIVPIYIESPVSERMNRALSRESKVDQKKYEEMSRRFMADDMDFQECNLRDLHINKKFVNIDFNLFYQEVKAWISSWTGTRNL